ncbi:hypothetical protein ACS0TY_010792 [Phlomoides rotata]
MGGPTDGDSFRQRKMGVRALKVEHDPEDGADIQGSHNDALDITTDITNYDVAQIFVDTGSSVDIMFLECFKKMDLNMKLEPVDTTIYGFSGGAIQPLGPQEAGDDGQFLNYGSSLIIQCAVWETVVIRFMIRWIDIDLALVDCDRSDQGVELVTPSGEMLVKNLEEDNYSVML